MSNCPEFWQSQKIKINVMNLTDVESVNINSIAAYVAIGLDLLVGILAFTFVWRNSKMPDVYRNSEDKLCGLKLFRGFGKMKFIFRINIHVRII